ncbi:MAG: sugar lactone lactonase YvrE [Moritella dasanensis]|jgi:sugar lactone lactonase YvrE
MLPLAFMSAVVQAEPTVGQLETVSQLPVRPGNVTVTNDGRIFATVHPFGSTRGLQLIEVINDTYKPWPSYAFQSTPNAFSAECIDTPLGITQDNQGHVWTVDMGLNYGKTRLWSFNIKDGSLDRVITLPADVAPKGSFIQDLVVDGEASWAYVADTQSKNSALLAVRLSDGETYRFNGHPSLEREVNAHMIIDGQEFVPDGLGVNPITLSNDGKSLYYGAMSGTHWYSVSTAALQTGNKAKIVESIKLVGRKPVSDGAAIDIHGNNYFTNLNENGIDTLTTSGELLPLVRNKLLDWPDSVQFGADGWLYISVNQLHKTKNITGKEDVGKAPYRIMRVWIGHTQGVRR